MLLIRAHCASAEPCLSSSLVIIRDTANVTVKGRLVSLIPFSKKTKRAETGKFARVLMERAHFACQLAGPFVPSHHSVPRRRSIPALLILLRSRNHVCKVALPHEL